MRKITIRLLFALLLLSFTSCKNGKSCEQPAEARWTIINGTNQQQNVEFDIASNGGSRTIQTHSLGPTSSNDILLVSYTYEVRPYHHGKFDLDPEDAECSSEPKISYSAIQLHDSNSNLKLCFEANKYIAHLLHLADTCPSNTTEYKRW